jgi:carbamoyl-phosphate synthase small subunit
VTAPTAGPAAATPIMPAAPAPDRPAILVLEDGRAFTGRAFGADGETFGEMVFSTGMTGYQETLTDPSYCGQIVAMTAPHIGNTGVNDEDPESRRIWVSGYVIREPARIASNWRSARTLEEELRAQGITGIAITGTRALTRHLRERGAMRAAISTTTADPAQLLQRVLASPPMAGADLVREVSAPAAYTVEPPPGTETRFTVAAVDLGIKAATPRQLAALGCRVHVLPATSTAADILACGLDGPGTGGPGTGDSGTGGPGPDGVFFSNGPGDPAALDYCVDAMRGVLAAGVPLFGICLGSQILGRALGLGTYKLRFGHRGVNQPVQDLRTGRVQITSHNHGFALAMPPAGGQGTAPAPALPFPTDFGPAVITHLNLNDGVVEGLRLLDAPAFAVQYHPEAAPGPHDAAGLFVEFCELMQQRRGHHAEAH